MDERDSQANEIVKRHVLLSTGAGLIPIPFVNLAGVMAVQMKMLSELSKNYGVDFSEHTGKSVVGSMLGGFLPLTTLGTAQGFLPMLPIIGGVVTIFALPLVSGAVTYAVGQVFTKHFASGGTLLDFDLSKAAGLFSSEYAKGTSDASSDESSKDETAPSKSAAPAKSKTTK